MARRYGTGTVYQRKRDQRWIGQAEGGRGPDGTRLRITVTADTEAAAWKALGTARSSSTKRRRGRAGESVEAFLHRWLRDVIYPTKRERTYVGYRSIVETVLIPAFGIADARQLVSRDVQRWVAGLRVSPMTVRHYVDCGRGAFRWGMRHGLRDDNPFANLDLPRVVRRDVTAMTPAMARRILAAVEDEWFAPLVTVALYTGLRQGELLGLRWEDVSLGATAPRQADAETPVGRHGGHPPLLGQHDPRTVRPPERRPGDRVGNGGAGDVEGSGRVRPRREVRADDLAKRSASLTVTRSLSRLPGAHGTRYVLTEPKSATSRRTVPLAPPAAAALSGLARDDNQWGLVFVRDGLPIDGTRLTREFQAELKAAKLPVIRWHDLRHATASLMIADGVPLSHVSEYLGHAGIGVTKDVYGHLGQETMREASDRLARVMEGA